MKNSKILILLLAIIMIISVSAVSAAEDIADSTDLAALDDSTPLEVDEAIDDVQAADGESPEPVETGNNFTSLQTLIDGEEVKELTLDKDYTRVAEDKDIEITKNITIDGQGKYTIDANNLGGIFKVNAGNTLTLKGLTLTNGKAIEGGAVWVDSGASLVVDDVKFTNNTGVYDGGAISNYGVASVDHSVFDANDLSNRKVSGGAAIWNEGTLTINNSEFKNNLKKIANRTNNDEIMAAVTT